MFLNFALPLLVLHCLTVIETEGAPQQRIKSNGFLQTPLIFDTRLSGYRSQRALHSLPKKQVYKNSKSKPYKDAIIFDDYGTFEPLLPEPVFRIRLVTPSPPPSIQLPDEIEASSTIRNRPKTTPSTTSSPKVKVSPPRKPPKSRITFPQQPPPQQKEGPSTTRRTIVMIASPATPTTAPPDTEEDAGPMSDSGFRCIEMKPGDCDEIFEGSVYTMFKTKPEPQNPWRIRRQINFG